VRRSPIARAVLTEEHLEDLVKRTRAGDERAWAEIWLALAPHVERIAGNWRVTSRLARSPDEVRDIVVRVMGELREDGFRLLGQLGERLAQRDGSYRRWFSTVAMNSALTYVRAHPHYLGDLGTMEGEGGRWATHLPVDETLEDERPDPMDLLEAHRILAWAKEELAPAQDDALHRWLRREDFGDISAALHLDGDPAAAGRLVRSAVKRLRDRYAVEGAAPVSRGRGRGGSRPDRRGSSTPATRRTGAKKIARSG
jgi:hypothetical protein